MIHPIRTRASRAPVTNSAAVLGGGITGITTAYALALRGFDVTVYERGRYAAMETSFANGGQLSASNAEVWTHPSTLLKGMQWMFRKDAPLLMNLKPSWHKYSWIAEFIGSIPHYGTNTTETARLAILAREHLFRWATEEGIDFDVEHRGIMHVYREKRSFEHARRVNALLVKGGLTRNELSPDDISRIEPTLQGAWYGGFLTPSDASGDIHKYTMGLAAAAVRRGVTIRYEADIDSVAPRDIGGARITLSNGEQHDHDSVVICAGVASRGFAAQLGDRVNVYPVKGYSITVDLDDTQSRAAAPHVSLLDDETKLVSSRLGEGRFRVAGTAEFNGFDRDIRADRIAPLTRWVESHFPGVSTERVTPWAGLRPMMPNMMPKVGAGRMPGVFYNTGHGHLGWTLAAATAESVATLISGAEAVRISKAA